MKGKSGASQGKSDSYGEMDEDTFTPNYTASGIIKVKVVLKKTNAAPIVRNITIAAAGTPVNSVGSYPSEKYLPVKVRNQRASENGSYGSVMCSATTSAMALSWFGVDQPTLTVANGVQNTTFDHRYGDWLFNVAYAGEQGLTSYCDFHSMEMLKYSISQGSPVGCSIVGTLPNSGSGTTSGHLVLAVGYKTVSGVNYIQINDPWTDSTHVANNTPYTVEQA